MAQPSFIKNIFLRFALSLPFTFKGIVVLPVLTRLYTQDIYSVWLQVILVKEISVNLLSLRLESALVRYLSAERDPEQVIKSAFTITLACSLCCLFLIYFFRDEVSNLIFGKQEFSSLLITASYWIVIGAGMQIGLAVLRSQEKIGTLSIRELLSALWLIGAVCFAYLMGLDIQRLILICIVGDAILLIWILFQVGVPVPIVSLAKSITGVRRFLPYSLPLVFKSVFLWLAGSVDRFLIVHLIGLASVGIYGVALQVSLLVCVVLSPINFVLFPRVAASWNFKNKNDVNHFFSQAVTLILILSAPVIVGLFVISDRFIPLLAGQNYATSKSLVLYLILSELVRMIFRTHIFVVHLVEKTLLLPAVFILSASINYLLCYLLLSKFGIVGAAIARLITFGLMAFVVTFWAQRHIKLALPWKTILNVIFISIIMGFSISWLPMDTWFQLLITVMAGILVHLSLLFIFRVLTFEKLAAIRRQFI